MSLPKSLINFANNKKHFEALLIPIGVIGIVVLILVIGFVIPKQKNNSGKNNADQYTQPTTVKTAEGKTQTVPPQVLQITPLQLKTMIDGKQKIIIIEVVPGDGWNYPHITGAEILPLKSFDTSTNGLDVKDTHIFVSTDGYASAMAISKLMNSGFPREKNFNLEGGVDAWRVKGYSVEQ